MRELKHMRFFPCGRRGSMECFEHLTSLRKPANFIKWLESYENGLWDPTILQQKHLAIEKKIESKLSLLGRDTILSQRNAVIMGYLKALNYGGLYKLDRKALQRKLNSHMVTKHVWEPATGNIELPTKRRSSKLKKQVKSKLIHQGKANFENHTVVANKKPHDTSLGVVHKIVSHTEHLGPAGKTKKAMPKKKQKQKKYIPRLVKIPNYPLMFTRYNPGEGNCFFHGLQQGLEKLGVRFLNEAEIRENLADWFQLETNQLQMEAHIGGPPSNFIGQLPDTGLYTPAEGWESYLAGRNWGWWGEHLRKKGTWVGVLEVPIINQMLDNIGLDIVVNVYHWRTGKIFGNEHNGTKTVIMLYLSPGHFELLEEEPGS